MDYKRQKLRMKKEKKARKRGNDEEQKYEITGFVTTKRRKNETCSKTMETHNYHAKKRKHNRKRDYILRTRMKNVKNDEKT